MAGKEDTTQAGAVVAPPVEAKAPGQAAPDTSQAAASSQQAASSQAGGEESWAKRIGKGNAQQLFNEGLKELTSKTETDPAKVEDTEEGGEGEGQPPATQAAPNAQQEQPETPEAKLARLEKELADRNEAEKKRQKDEQARSLRDLTINEQNELRGRLSIIDQQKQDLAELETELQEAVEDFGQNSPQAAKLWRRFNTVKTSLGAAVFDYNSRLANIQNSTTSRQLSQVAEAVNATLAPYGVTFDEIKAASPGANLDDFNKVLEGAVKLAVSKEQAKIKADREKEKADNARREQELKDERLKWGQSAGAQPDRGIASGTNAGAGGRDVLSQIKSGKSSTQLISEGLRARK